MSWYTCGCCENILDGDEEPGVDFGDVELVCPDCILGFELMEEKEALAEDKAKGEREEVVAFGMRKG